MASALQHREAAKALSCAGVPDSEIVARFPGLTPEALRQWRNRDAIWKACFSAVRRGLRPNGPGRPTKEESERLQVQNEAQKERSQIVTSQVEESFPDMIERNSLLLAKTSERSIRTFSKRPPTPKTWGELRQCYSVFRLATGQDSEQGPAVAINLWGAMGVNTTAAARPFRNVGSQAAQEGSDPASD